MKPATGRVRTAFSYAQEILNSRGPGTQDPGGRKDTDHNGQTGQLSRSARRARACVTSGHPTEPGALRSYLAQANLLILDLPQADTKDFELLKQIRRMSTVPVILLVTSDDYRVSIKGLDRGADHVMSKPVNDKELDARVRALLRRAHAPPPTASLLPGAESLPVANWPPRATDKGSRARSNNPQ